MNLYEAMGNDAVNYVDPEGLFLGERVHDYWERRIEYNFQHDYMVNAAIDSLALAYFGKNDVDLALAVIPLPIGRIKLVGEAGEICLKDALRGMRNPVVKAAVERGLAEHANFHVIMEKEGYIANKAIPGTRLRPDALDPAKKLIIELKPGPSSAARKQLDGYVNEAQKAYGGKWEGKFRYYGKQNCKCRR